MPDSSEGVLSRQICGGAEPNASLLHTDSDPLRLRAMARVHIIMRRLHIRDVRLEKLEAESTGGENRC